jgi:hypothetical protein
MSLPLLYDYDEPRFFLVQRLSLAQKLYDPSKLSFGQVFNLHYMGSAEFEFGAFAKWIRHMHDCATPRTEKRGLLRRKITMPFTLETFSAVVGGIQVYGAFDKEKNTEISVLSNIELIAKGKRRCKGHPGFPPAKGSSFEQTIAWAEIELGVFWSLIDFREELPGMLSRSVAYMDEETS